MLANNSSRDPTLSREIALSDRNVNFTMIGLSLAIFTFLLVFLFNRASTGSIDPVLFQVTLGDAVGAVFSFSVSGLYNYILILGASAEDQNARLHRKRAELFFSVALFMLLLEPALILFTIGLAPVGSAALIFFLGYLAMYAYAHRRTITEARRSHLSSDFAAESMTTNQVSLMDDTWGSWEACPGR